MTDAPAICPHCGYDLELEAPVTFGRLSYQPRVGVCFDGLRIKMAPQCHEIFGALIRSSGTPITRGAFMERLGWDDRPTNVFDVRLSQTRKALRELGFPDIIKTIRPGSFVFDAAHAHPLNSTGAIA